MKKAQENISYKDIKRKQIIDVIIIIVLAAVVYIFASSNDILEAVVDFSRLHENWEADEIIPVFLFLVFALLVFVFRRWSEVRELNVMLASQKNELEKALSEIKQLRGILPICAECKKIRDDKGYWHQVELYVREHTDAQFSHSICPDCKQKLYPELYDDKDMNVN